MIPSWLVIAGVILLVSSGASLTGVEGIRWFNRLQRPRWLTFERLIPVIWTFIFICAGWSAYIVWESDPGSPTTWWCMALYLLLEIVTISYTPVMCRLRSLEVGTIIGGIGFVIAFILIFAVYNISINAVLLLAPYLLWSPIGTYTTWVMDGLNSGNA
jgi:translocator protein